MIDENFLMMLEALERITAVCGSKVDLTWTGSTIEVEGVLVWKEGTWLVDLERFVSY